MIATSAPAPPSKETLRKRRVWSPSPRERAMYRAVAVEGRTQGEVGAEFGRSQSAVSRLVKRFERWRGGTKGGEESGELDPKRQARLDRWLERERAEEVYQRSMRLALKMELKPATTRREGDRGVKEGGKIWFEETKRDQLAAAGQMLKTALRASEQLGKLSEKPAPPLPAENPEVDELRLFRDLMLLRDEAEEAGRVPKSRDIYYTIHAWQQALLGGDQMTGLPSEYEPGTVYGELARAVLSGRRVGSAHQASSAESDGTAPDADLVGTAHPTDAAAAPKPQSPDHSPLTDSPLTPPPPQTHKRIDDIDQYYAPIPNPPRDTTRSRGNPYDPLSGLMRVVMIDPATGKKIGATDDEYADDPLGRTYQRAKERHERERRGW